MNILSVVISLGWIIICNADAENSRLLLQINACPCNKMLAPVCCDGNVDFGNQCGADCVSATNCIKGACDDLADTACETVRCAVPGTECQIKEGGTAGQVECVMIPEYCATDSDCAVKNIGNCCGYYPGCVNTNYEPDLDAIQAECDANGMNSICGFSTPSGCTCQNQRCVTEYTPITPPNQCDTFVLPEGYTQVGTPESCARILFMCESGYTHWSNECGCGCKPDCALLPLDYRVIVKPDMCDTAKFACNIGEEYFRNECGCGCKAIVDPCAATSCLTGNECVNNGDGTASCVPLKKQGCRIRGSNKCNIGYVCRADPACDGNVTGRERRNRRNRGVCVKQGGACGGFVNQKCESIKEECSYPCGSTLGECVTYQYKQI